MQINVYRNRSVVETFKVDDKAKVIQRFYGENQIKTDIKSRSTLNLSIGDYIVHNGIKYYLNTLPDVTKEATNSFKYSLSWESEYYDLAKVQFQLDDESAFDYVCSAEDLIDLIVTNLNRVYGTSIWSKGSVSITTQTRSFFTSKLKAVATSFNASVTSSTASFISKRKRSISQTKQASRQGSRSSTSTD